MKTQEEKREYWKKKQQERRNRLKAAGLPCPPRGKPESKKSGGKRTHNERMRRYRARKKMLTDASRRGTIDE